MKKRWHCFLAALLLLSSLAGCGKSSKGEASVESVSMICGLNGVGQVDRFAGVVSAQGETKDRKGREPAGDLRGREGRGMR